MNQAGTTTKGQSYFLSQSNLNLLKSCINMNKSALLIGETGTGKTTMIRELAKESGKVLHRVSVNGSMGVEEILGKWLVEKGTTVWQDGILTMAMKTGSWIVMDEINAALPEILFVLHSLLDDDRKITLAEKDNQVIVPHGDFRFFATMNPPEEYAGTKDMNKALMSRFTAVLQVEVLDNKQEIELLVIKGSETQNAVKLVELANVLRKAKKEEQIFYFCSTRDLIHSSDLIKDGVDFMDAVEGAILNKMSEDELEVVAKSISTITKSKAAIPNLPLSEVINTFENYKKEMKKMKEDTAKREEEFKQILKNELEAQRQSLAGQIGGGPAGDKLRQDLLKKIAKIVEKDDNNKKNADGEVDF